MKCFFCNEEIDNNISEYPPLDSCFNCGRPLCSDCRGGTEKIAGDIRGVFCQYCIEIRDFEVFPIEIDTISQWVDILNTLLNDISSEPLRNALAKIISDMKRIISERDETLI